MSVLGALLRGHRGAARLTQEELAERAGVSARTISDIERGVRSRAYSDTAARLSVALGLMKTDRATFLAIARGRDSALETAAAPRVRRPLTPLVGRERELDDAVSALGTRGTRLVTITGLGGVGKTRLALAAAAELEGLFGGRVHMVDLATHDDPEFVMGTMARSLGLPDRSSPEALATHVAGRPTLVLLDTFEHVLSAAPDLAATLLAAPDLRVLATSRERLKIAGEVELALQPLAVSRSSDPRWFESPAARLFLERVGELGPDLDADPDQVIDICREVSGVPLALELAAARVRHLPLAALRDRLRAGLGDLEDPGGDRPERHRSMEQTLTWSTASLTEGEALMLRVGALFPGGWSLDAAQSLCGSEVDVVRAVSGLVDKSLVFLDASSAGNSDGARWRMLHVVREFVRGPAPHRVEAKLRRSFTAFFLTMLAEVEKHVGREHEWFELLAAEEANVRTPLMWAADDGDADVLLRLAGGMWQFWLARGALTEGRRWLETGFGLRPPASDGTRMTALWGAGWLAYHQADDRAAEAAALELEDLARTRGDARARRNGVTIRGMVAISREDAPGAVTLLTEALRLSLSLDHSWILATSQLNLGLGYLSAGETEHARAVIGDALAAYEEIGDERFRARCVGYLGLTSLIEDDPDRARALFAQSLSVFRQLAEPGGTAEGLGGIAAVDAATGNLARASTLAAAAERLRESYAGRELPLDRRTTNRYLASAESHLGEGAWSEAYARGRNLPLDEAIDLALASSG